MGKVDFDRWLAGTALAVALAVTTPMAFAAPDSQKDIEAAVPVPPPADLKPITPADLEPAKPAAQAAEPAAAVQKSVEPKAAETKPAEAQPVAAVTDPVTDKIRELLTAKSERSFMKRGDKAAAEAFYAARKYAPLWVTSTGASDRGKAAVAYLMGIEADGLEPDDYPIPALKDAKDADALADAEIKLTASVIAYARHAQTGRVNFTRVSGDIYYQQDVPEPADVLAKLADATDVAAALDSFEPQHPQYKALKAQLAKVRGKSEAAAPVRIGPGPTLKFGKTAMQDPRVPQLRERLGLAAKDGDTTYDKQLAEAVTKFQKANGLKPDGYLGSGTIAALNGPKREKTADIIIANMERWRWMPRDLGRTHVMLNIPDFSLRVVRDGSVYWQTKVVVGKPGTPTPILTAAMQYITVNPTWNVPPSIVYGEYLPALQQDPTVLERMGLKLTQNADGSVHIAQPPGDRNALGRIRFNFPNKFLVYQHDTPEKHLFARYPRAYSHGCMRVEDPVKYAEVILSLVLPKDGYTQERIRRMYGPSEVDIRFPSTLPVHITYQTAFVDDHGQLVLRDDVYGRDARMIAILKGDERKVADVGMDRPQPSYSRPSVTLPPGVAGSYSSGGGGGGNFFEMLFGGGPRYSPPAAVGRSSRQARGTPRTLSW
ncbi:MAG TPA: L,D-transpeptidase family protein [Xanthobacteraceae bacterium]|nr:L,D-transpeptidase family protein [Xanthobacteraceae bacterium]